MRLSLALTLAALAACNPLAPVPDPGRYYTLRAAASPLGDPPGPIAVVGLRPVRVAAYLDRPQIVTRAGPDRVEAGLDRWAAPLDALVAQAVAEALRDAAPSREVLAWPWPRGASPDAILSIDLLRLEREPDGAAVLEARWSVTLPAGTAVERGVSRVRRPTADPAMASSVAAMGEALGALVRDLAAALERAEATAPARRSS